MTSVPFEPSGLGYRGMRSPRCAGCRLLIDDCLCDELEPVASTTAVRLHMHALELSRPSNTGWLVARMLPGARVLVHGRGGVAPLEPGHWLALHADGRPLRPEDAGAGLLVADGTWSQVRRMNRRIEALASVERVRVTGTASIPPVRRGAHPGLFCTAEAVARALGVLGETEVEAALLRVLERWARRTLARRHGGGAEAIARRLRLAPPLVPDPDPRLR